MIVQAKKTDGTPVYYRTLTKAVVDEQGQTLEEILSSRYSPNGIPAIDMKLPFDVAKVKIICSQISADPTTNTITRLTTSKNVVGVIDDGDKDMEGVTTDADGNVHCNMKVEFSSQDLNFDDYCAISYQGQTSLGHPKKNFTIDFLQNHKFGKWLEFDSFHLKGYYVDWLHSRDWAANILWEQICLSKSVDKRRAYLPYNDFDNDFRQRTDLDVLCHVDAFPVELYINNEYWGLYTWRIKKHRDNYLMGKSNTNHILIDPSWMNFDNFQWSGIEIRNPKSDSGNTSFEEGVEPNPGEVKTAIVAFDNAMKTASTKAAFGQILNEDDMIDYLVFVDFGLIWDILIRNTLWGTWDGVHFSPMPYDMDSSWGYGYTNTSDWSSSLINYDTDVFQFYKEDRITTGAWLERFRTLYANEIKERYKLYRDKGIFSVENVESIFANFGKWVGYKAYKRDTERWNYPTNGYGTHGFYDSIERVVEFMTQRIAYMDSVML